MQPFTTLTGLVAPLDRVNVDTDQIIPKQFLKTLQRTGLKEGLFLDWRRRRDGTPDPDFFMNQPRYRDATILLARDNFGCGSSREHAPWALLDQGFRCVIAPSFADIFYNNCFQNGILPVVLKADEVQALFQAVAAREGYRLTVDLAAQTVATPEAAPPPITARKRAPPSHGRMERELTLLCEAVRRAGLRAMELRRDGFETFIKPDRSPVTTADLAVDRMLREALLAAFPDDGWLSEETADDPIRLEKKRVWVVDPIDGTKYFMRGESQFAVSAALVQEGTVVAGAVFNPATDELFGAARGLGTRLNGVRVPVPPPAGERLVVLVNPPALERGTFAAYAPHADCRPMGSI